MSTLLTTAVLTIRLRFGQTLCCEGLRGRPDISMPAPHQLAVNGLAPTRVRCGIHSQIGGQQQPARVFGGPISAANTGDLFFVSLRDNAGCNEPISASAREVSCWRVSTSPVLSTAKKRLSVAYYRFRREPRWQW